MTLRDDIKHILFEARIPISRGEVADAILYVMEKHSGWQPIETAPHDGTQVLALMSNGWYGIISHRAEPNENRHSYRYWRCSSYAIEPPVVETHPENTDWKKYSTILAEWWMPLPSPPVK